MNNWLRRFREVGICFWQDISLAAVVLLLIATGSALAQTNWTKFANNPVLDIGPVGAFDDGHVWHHSLLFEEQVFKMWFTGAPVSRRAGHIGFATSTDGISWTKDPANPVMSPGAAGEWDEPIILNPVVIRDGETLKMWYGGNNFNKGRVGYATSTNGINWTKNPSNPVLDAGPAGSWDELGCVPQSVIFDGNLYHMWYFGPNAGFRFRIGYATSPDGITWTKYNDPSTTDSPFIESDPVLKPGPTGSWDAESVANHWVLFDGLKFHMWYEAFDQNSTVRIGYAWSFDGITWVKHDGPVLVPGPFRSWDDAKVGQPKVLLEGNTFHMWYIGNSDASGNFRIGYATAPNDMPTSISENRNASPPTTFSLAQNYPNPFNPTTTITYKLPQAEFVDLSIYNAVGQLVETLVNGEKSAGSHSLQWDASNLTSGIYFYRIKAGNFSAVNKGLLLR